MASMWTRKESKVGEGGRKCLALLECGNENLPIKLSVKLWSQKREEESLQKMILKESIPQSNDEQREYEA